MAPVASRIIYSVFIHLEVSFDIELPDVLLVGGPLEYGESGVVDAGLAPLRRLQDVLLHEDRRHVNGLRAPAQRTDKLLHVDLEFYHT